MLLENPQSIIFVRSTYKNTTLGILSYVYLDFCRNLQILSFYLHVDVLRTSVTSSEVRTKQLHNFNCSTLPQHKVFLPSSTMTVTQTYIMVLYITAATVSAYTSHIHLISHSPVLRRGNISRRFQGSLKRAAKGK